jgi:hypothetical protein
MLTGGKHYLPMFLLLDPQIKNPHPQKPAISFPPSMVFRLDGLP